MVKTVVHTLLILNPFQLLSVTMTFYSFSYSSTVEIMPSSNLRKYKSEGNLGTTRLGEYAR